MIYYGLLAESASGDMRIEQHIEPEQYERYLGAIAQVDKIRMQQHYALVERNYRKLTSTRHYFVNGFQEGLLDSTNNTDAMFAYNSDMVNWLASARLFLDHTERRPDTDEVKTKFTKATNEEHSKSRAYRVMYKMRDYTLHCSFLITSLSVQVDEDSGRLRDVSVRFIASRTAMLDASLKWGKQKG